MSFVSCIQTPDSYGSLIELCWKGTKDVILQDGQKRKFLQDGDEVTLIGNDFSFDMMLLF